MKMRMMSTALSLCLIAPATTIAQTPGQSRTSAPPQFTPPALRTSKGLFGGSAPKPPKVADPGTRDSNVLRSGESVPEPVDLNLIKAQSLPALTEPIGPYLLQKEHGPFMVLAHTFRGPDAAKNAQHLTMELRRDYQLPAYIWLARVQPSRSNIRNVQPTAPAHARNGDFSEPEGLRMYDEAAVLVGDCKTIDESEKVLHQVKKIKPKCLQEQQNLFMHRRGKGLDRAFLTTNPFQPSQNLFPGAVVAANGAPIQQGKAFDPFLSTTKFEAPKVDNLVRRINQGQFSLFKNSGAYTLQVAEFTGRSTIAVNSQKGAYSDRVQDRKLLETSPLVTAADDAERLAEAINKCRAASGVKAYTYHSRSSSYVTLGSFNSPADPNQQPVRSRLDSISNELMKRGFSQVPLYPSGALMAVPKDR